LILELQTVSIISMALGEIKEKLKEKLHLSKHHEDNSTSGSTSRAANRSSVVSNAPAHDHLSDDRNARCTFAPEDSVKFERPLTTVATVRTSHIPAAAATSTSKDSSSRRSSISANSLNDSSLSRAGAPGLHNTEYKLPQVPIERDFSSDFSGLTFGSQNVGRTGENVGGEIPTLDLDDLDEGRNSENIADRNIHASANNRNSVRIVPQFDEHSRSQPLIPGVDHHSNNVAEWNMVRNDDPAAGSRNDAPQPLNVKKRTSYQPRVDALASEASERDHNDMRDPSWSITPLAMEGFNDKSPLDARGNISNLNREVPLASDADLAPQHSTLDKSLPPTPGAMISRDQPLGVNGRALNGTSNNGNDFLARAQGNPAGPFDLSGVAVKKEEDTVSLHEYHAPAVTHEVIKKQRDEVIQKVITRETHDYHIYHRVLPIIDIEVLPARHFVPVQDGYVEIAEEELPGRTRDKVNWAIAEMVSKRTPAESREAAIARTFTARKFVGTEGDDREYIGPEGHPVTEKWWVYPPTVAEDSYRAGQSYPFHFGSANARDDGLKARLPAGNVVGVSKALLEKRKRQARQMAAADEHVNVIPRKPVLSQAFV
jgi:hypothetical protein